MDNFRKAHPQYDNEKMPEGYVEEVLRWFGGFEMVAAVGAMLRAAELRMTVLVDGFIMTACMLIASRLNPSVLPYAVFCHEGNESGHKLCSEAMARHGACYSSTWRLAEGTGAVCAYPILQSALRMIGEMNNFENANITKYF